MLKKAAIVNFVLGRERPRDGLLPRAKKKGGSDLSPLERSVVRRWSDLPPAAGGRLAGGPLLAALIFDAVSE